MNRPLLSIVVPTKDRIEYAYWCVRSLQSMLSPACEIVIHDNSKTDELNRHLIRERATDLVKYIWVGGDLSITDNCDRAIAAATGEYVTLIGDDDAVGPDLEAVARWASHHQIDAVVPANKANFYWPDLYGDCAVVREDAALIIKPYTGRIQRRRVEHGMATFLRHGGLGIANSVRVPKLYYGLVRRDRMEEVRIKTDTYFPGISPDVAIAVALCTVVRSLYSVDYPLYLPGSSYKSGAGAGARKQHFGKLEDQKHLSADYLKTWPNCVPKIYTVQTLWAATVVQSLRALGREDLIAKFNFSRMFAFCYLFNATLRKPLMNAYRQQSPRRMIPASINRARFVIHLLEGVGLRLWTLIARKARLKSVVGESRLTGPTEIAAASKLFQEILQRTPRRLQLD